MKKQTVVGLIVLFIISILGVEQGQAQKDKKKEQEKPSAYIFTTIKELPNTSVKDQYRSGTCWSFSGISFFESELLRKGKGQYDLSDMYSVYVCYLLKGDKYIRLHGNSYFPTGGASNDVLYVLKNAGMVPEEAFKGLNYDTEKHEHAELDRVLSGFLDAVAKGKTITPAWRQAYKGILESYLGSVPEKFTYKEKEYTAKTFGEELGLKVEDYIKVTSYTHHPFYTSYEMDVPDNWNHGMVYNLPLDEFEQVADTALFRGYTLVWGGDVSDRGFSWKNGVAIVPDQESEDIKGTDRDKWESMSEKDKQDAAYKFEKRLTEKRITQEIRQKEYDKWISTDDHGMHIIGVAVDQQGQKYYKVKNSWNTSNPYKGYIYMSSPYFRARTLDMMVHKEALPAAIKAKLGL